MKVMRHLQRGFALPTILIASVVMLFVLISAVSATASIRSALDGQYYDRLAREAAESGIARANDCLQKSAFIVNWSDASKLYPNTTCSGGASCTNADSCFVMKSGSIRTTFEVGQPVNFATAQTVTATGRVDLLRPSGAVWRSYTSSASARVGVDLNINTVAFGYDGRDGGAYFATIAADGKMNAVGFNYNGWLGNGTKNSTLTPTPFQLNGTDRAAAIFAGFQSQGFNMFAITDKGTVYGAGLNDEGQLGDGTLTDRSIPVKFTLPVGAASATNVTVGGRATFVTTADGKVYAAGQCDRGSLGTTYTISGCSDRSTPALVKLPTPTSDPNTIPTNNFIFDANSGVVIMQGGRIYSWGGNGYGQLGRDPINDSSTPAKAGTYGDAGQPKAVDIAFDGDTLYVVGDDGSIKTMGRNSYAETGGDSITIQLLSDSKCFENKSANGLDVRLATCSDSLPQQRWAFRSDGSLYNPNSDKCLENTNSNGTDLRLATCNGATKQVFVLQDDGTLKNPASNSCLNNKAGDDVTTILYACNGSGNEVLYLPAAHEFVNFQLPASAGKAVKVDSDQWSVSVLTDNGEVWSAGRNEFGELGNGTTSAYQPYPVKFILPSGVKATDILSSAFYGTSSISNLMVIGSDGKVYGAGSNSYGQLGDGTTTDRSTPVAMNVIDGTGIRAKSVATGFGTTVIITYGKKLYTVGNNSNGQLGDGTTNNSLTPKANKYTNVLPIAIF